MRRPPAQARGGYCCGDACEDKTKTKHNMGELSHGRAWELKLEEEEERRQEQAGQGCDGGSSRPLEQRRAGSRERKLEGWDIGGVNVGDSLESGCEIPHCCLKMPHRKVRFGVGIQGSLGNWLWSAYGRGITSGQKSRIAKDKEARVGTDIWILGVDKGGKAGLLTDLHSLTASPG